MQGCSLLCLSNRKTRINVCILTKASFSFFMVIVLCILAVTSESIANKKSSADSRQSLKQELTIGTEGLILKGEIHEGYLETRQSVKIPIQIDKTGCYVVKAAGNDKVEDMSLALYVSGLEQTGDRLSGRRPSLEWCASETGTAEIELLMYAGSGSFAIAVFYKESARTQKGKLQIGGKETDFIANRIRQLHTQLGKGRSATSELLRGNLKQNTEIQFTISNVIGCITVIAVQESSLRNITVTLSDKSGNIPFIYKNTDTFLWGDTESCVKTTQQIIVTVKANSGAGNFGLQVFSE